MKRTLTMILALLIGLSSCAYAGDDEMFTERDQDASYEEDRAVHIVMDGDSATASSNSVIIGQKIIQITEEATYILSGTWNDGMIVVNANDQAKIQLVLNGVHITSATCAPLYILEADKVFVTLADGTENTLVNGGSFEPIDDNAIDAAVFSKQDLTLNGGGRLTVTSPAGHGIVSKDDLVFTSGDYHIEAAAHGVDANDSVRIMEASLTVHAGKDGIRAENNDDSSRGFVYVESGSLAITAEGDGISAGAYAQLNGGNFTILAGGGHENAESQSSDSWGHFGGFGRKGYSASSSAEATDEDSSTSMKGVKAEGQLTISGGTFHIDSADDAIHSNASVTIDGGTFAIASGDDAFHAEDRLCVTGGTIDISHSYEGLEALHVEVSGGEIRLIASDDGLNAAGGTDESGTTGGRDGKFGGGGHRGFWGSGNSDGTIVISGGTLHIQASGDGIDANGTLLISGGHTTVTGPLRGDTTVLDYDISGEITGGTFVGTGSSMMAQSLSGSGQGVIAVSVGSQEAGAAITVVDAKGAQILNHAPELPYEIFIFSSPDLVSGDNYTLSIGTLTGEVAAN